MSRVVRTCSHCAARLQTRHVYPPFAMVLCPRCYAGVTTTHELPVLTPEQMSRRAELLGHVLGPWQASATGYPVRRCTLCRERVQDYSLDPTVRHA